MWWNIARFGTFLHEELIVLANEIFVCVCVGVGVGVARKKKENQVWLLHFRPQQMFSLPHGPCFSWGSLNPSLDKTAVVSWSPFFRFSLPFSPHNPLQNYPLCYPINLRVIFLKNWTSQDLVRKKESTLQIVGEDLIKETFYSEHKGDTEIKPDISNFKVIVTSRVEII